MVFLGLLAYAIKNLLIIYNNLLIQKATWSLPDCFKQ